MTREVDSVLGRSTLANCGIAWGIDTYLTRPASQAEENPQSNAFADALLAVIATVFLDSGEDLGAVEKVMKSFK